MKGMRTAAIAAAIVLSTSLCKTSAGEAPILQENGPTRLPAEQTAVDAFGYLGGLLEARFYEPHATTDEPREEIRRAALLYGIDLPMMLSSDRIHDVSHIWCDRLTK